LNGETVIAKAFQLGIMAPAILVGLQSGVALSQQQEQLSAVRKQLSEIQAGERPVKVSSVGPAAAPSFFIATAHAKGDGDAPVPKGEHRKVGVGARFWYGVTGSLADGWFVIAGSHKDRQSADAQAAQLRSKGWNVVVGDSLVWGGYYAVQVGSYLPKARAEEIRIKAIDDGLPKDTFTWHR
jgi:cell division protein FtsN